MGDNVKLKLYLLIPMKEKLVCVKQLTPYPWDEIERNLKLVVDIMVRFKT